MPILPSSLHALIGSKPADPQTRDLLNCIAADIDRPSSIKAYPDVVYYNYDAAGLSLVYSPASNRFKAPPRQGGRATTRTDIDESELALSSVDIYADRFDFDAFNLSISHPGNGEQQQSTSAPASNQVNLSKGTTGRDLVSALGEPDRKGGGESKSVGVWLEWTGLGLMVEFTSIHGAGRWDLDRGAGSGSVGVITLFQPGKEVGSNDEEHDGA